MVVDLSHLAFPAAGSVPIMATPLVQPARLPGIQIFPRSPGDPGYAARIPPGAPDPPKSPEEIIADAIAEAAKLPSSPPPTAVAAATPSQPTQRLVINYGRGDGTYSLALIAAPDWDIVGRPKTVSGDALRELYPIVARIVKIQNMTEDDLESA